MLYAAPQAPDGLDAVLLMVVYGLLPIGLIVGLGLGLGLAMWLLRVFTGSCDRLLNGLFRLSFGRSNVESGMASDHRFSISAFVAHFIAWLLLVTSPFLIVWAFVAFVVSYP